MRIISAREMRELDRETVERLGLSWAMLMEAAGASVVEAIVDRYGRVEGRRFAVFCGRGNNGGDGAVIARHLWLRRAARVDLLLCGSLDSAQHSIQGEARTNLEIIARLAAHSDQALGWRELDEAFAPLSANYDFVIDAVFGTGLSRPAEGLAARAIDEINRLRRESGAIVVAVDIPSGLASDHSRITGPHVTADLTVAFTAPKLANALPPASNFNGELRVAPIGTPDWLIEELAAPLDRPLFMTDQAEVGAWLRASERAPDAHKTSVGDVLVIAGSRGKTGAASLTAAAVLRSGAGLVTVATARSAQPLLVAQALDEVMTEALDEVDGGAVSHEAIERAIEIAARRTVVAIGPGLSSAGESTRRFVRDFIARRARPVVVDADALNALSPWPEELRGSAELPIVVTPHPGEMARLTGKTNEEIVADRLAAARDFAVAHGAITVLKGQRTIVAAPDGSVYVNPTGNAGMATAGAGDVLTGIIAGLIAQRPAPPLAATLAAVYLHGKAGDLAAQHLGARAMIASSITDQLPAAYRAVRPAE